MTTMDPSVSLVTADGAVDVGGQLYMSAKSVSGIMQQYGDWSAPVTVIVPPRPGVSEPGTLDEPVDTTGTPIVFRVSTDPAGELRAARSQVWTTLLAPSTLGLLESQVPGRLVTYVENDLRNRIQYALTTSRSSVDRARIRLGAVRRELRVRRVARRCLAIQFNGPVAYGSYRSANPDCLLYLDSRVHESSLPRQPLRRTSSDGTLELAFSGRLVEPKGVRDAVRAVQQARSGGVRVRLHVFGSGELEHLIPRQDEGFVHHGSVPYEPDWVEFMQCQVDALLIPHLQADPSCTYLEGMGCALPFVSYDNRMAVSLSELSGAAWLAPMGHVDALAHTVAEVAASPDLLAQRRDKALRFARAHTFESECVKRSEHLRQAYRRSLG